MSAITGSGERATISWSASAAWWSGTAGRTISQPASLSAAIWLSVARTSRVSVLVMVWTAIGAAPPTTTSPTRTGIDFLRGGVPFCALKSSPQPGKLPGRDALDVQKYGHTYQRDQRDQTVSLDCLLTLSVERPTAELLEQDHQNAPPVQCRQGQQVGQPEGHREVGHYQQVRDQALRRGVVGKVPEADEAREAIGAEDASWDLTRGELVDPPPEGGRCKDGKRDAGVQGLARRDQGRGLDPDHVVLLLTAVAGRDDSVVGSTVRALHGELKRLPRPGVLCPADVPRAVNGLAVDSSDGVTGSDAVRVRGAVYVDLDYFARVVIELCKGNAGDEDHRDDEVHAGAGQQDQQPLMSGLGVESFRIFVIVWHHAAQLHVTAERDGSEGVERTASDPGPEPRSDAHRKLVDPHAKGLGHREVPGLVGNDQDEK